MAFNLEHFTLTLAIGLLVCLGIILIWNAVFETRGLDLLRPYEPKEALLGVALAVAFVVGFLAEDGFDSVAPDFFDEREAGYWEPLNTNAFANSRFLEPKQLSTYQKIEKYLIPASKEKIRFQSLFGSAVLNNDEPRRRELKWHAFAQYYYEFGLFEKFIPKNDADRNLYDALISAIRDKRQISLETCYADEKCVCYKIRNGCYSSKVINKYIENFVDQVYYHSKNLIFINKNYFDELTDRERRVNFSRTITYVSLAFFLFIVAILSVQMIVWAVRTLATPFDSGERKPPSLANASYLLVPAVSFFLLAFMAKHAYEFEQDQVNKRVFGYTTSLGLLARQSGRENAFERYFLGLGSEPGSPEPGSKPSGM